MTPLAVSLHVVVVGLCIVGYVVLTMFGHDGTGLLYFAGGTAASGVVKAAPPTVAKP